MSIFDDDDYSGPISNENVYLTSPQKGLELISSLCAQPEESGNAVIYQLDQTISQHLLPLMAKVHVDNESGLYHQLMVLHQKIKELNKFKLLKNKSIVGVGGQFSAGKSSFINALSDMDKLPEAQTPTTSIATYIINSPEDAVAAYTVRDNFVKIDDDALHALTHAFYEKYEMGFEKIIKNLFVQTPSFKSKGIAILDTPGYSKPDVERLQRSADVELARQQLSSVDYLIWLIDADNGAIKSSDLEFIESLAVKNDILIVFNKADKRTDDDMKSIIAETKNILSSSGISIYDIIGYSSIKKQECFGTDKLNEFLLKAEQDTNGDQDIVGRFDAVYNAILNAYNLMKENLDSEIKKNSDILNSMKTLSHISVIADISCKNNMEVKTMAECIKELKDTSLLLNQLYKCI